MSVDKPISGWMPADEDYDWLGYEPMLAIWVMRRQGFTAMEIGRYLDYLVPNADLEDVIGALLVLTARAKRLEEAETSLRREMMLSALEKAFFEEALHQATTEVVH